MVRRMDSMDGYRHLKKLIAGLDDESRPPAAAELPDAIASKMTICSLSFIGRGDSPVQTDTAEGKRREFLFS